MRIYYIRCVINARGVNGGNGIIWHIRDTYAENNLIIRNASVFRCRLSSWTLGRGTVFDTEISLIIRIEFVSLMEIVTDKWRIHDSMTTYFHVA